MLETGKAGLKQAAAGSLQQQAGLVGDHSDFSHSHAAFRGYRGDPVQRTRGHGETQFIVVAAGQLQ